MVDNKDGKKRLMFMLSTKGKTKEQITNKAVEAYDKFVDTAKTISGEGASEKPLLSVNELSFNDFLNIIG